MKQNQDYKNAALTALKGNWVYAIVATIVLILIAGVLGIPSAFASIAAGSGSALVAIFLGGPLQVGFDNSFKRLYFYSDHEVTKNIFIQGFSNYLHIVWGNLLMSIYLILWSLLLVVPGILKYFAYAMTPYILVDNPELSADQAIHRSREMMNGRKFDLFYLYLSFIGWYILALITCGIGFFWLIPYVGTAKAAFYEDVKTDYEARTIQITV